MRPQVSLAEAGGGCKRSNNWKQAEETGDTARRQSWGQPKGVPMRSCRPLFLLCCLIASPLLADEPVPVPPPPTPPLETALPPPLTPPAIAVVPKPPAHKLVSGYKVASFGGVSDAPHVLGIIALPGGIALG